LEGFVTESIDNGPDAGRKVLAARVDFVLCDDNMPGLRGAQVIALIRARKN